MSAVGQTRKSDGGVWMSASGVTAEVILDRQNARVLPRPGASENRACELTAKIVALLIILYASGVVGLFIYDHLL